MKTDNNIAAGNRKQSLVCFYLFHLYGGKSSQLTEERKTVGVILFPGNQNTFALVSYRTLLKETDIQLFINENVVMQDGILPMQANIVLKQHSIVPKAVCIDKISRVFSIKMISNLTNMQILSILKFRLFKKNILC